MNKSRVFWALLCSAVMSISVKAQEMVLPIEPVNLFISNAFTSTLLFPYAIKKASWCSPHFAVQQTKEVSNLLEIKSTTADFPPSNLSVVTSDGHFYSFMIYYDAEPYHLNYRLEKDSVVKQTAVEFTEHTYNEEQLQQLADAVEQQTSPISRKYKSDLLKGQLRGIYSSDQMTWLKVRLKNRQSAAVSVSSSEVMITDQLNIRSGIAQHKRITPLYSSTPLLLQRQKQTLIIGIPRTILSKRKRLHLQLHNEEGGQLLDCKIPSRLLLKAQPISYP